MRSKRVGIIFMILIGLALYGLSCGNEPGSDSGRSRAEAETGDVAPLDSLGQKVLLDYVRGHFDDIHDVTMRYHHRDHTINGLVAIEMVWEGGTVRSAKVLTNETGDEDLPLAMIEKIQGWKVEGLDGPSKVVLPFNVRLVGMDDPEFLNTGIMTGEVMDADGNPLSGALIMIRPQVAGLVHRAETNREGIFVRTLIPPGVWDVECSLSGYGAASKVGLKIMGGEHCREKFVLNKK
ncbi:MAG: carboxypeptidase-like regulatory domain-containing protein [bacterium]|jgi:hypothetical protein